MYVLRLSYHVRTFLFLLNAVFSTSYVMCDAWCHLIRNCRTVSFTVHIIIAIINFLLLSLGVIMRYYYRILWCDIIEHFLGHCCILCKIHKRIYDPKLLHPSKLHTIFLLEFASQDLDSRHINGTKFIFRKLGVHTNLYPEFNFWL